MTGGVSLNTSMYETSFNICCCKCNEVTIHLGDDLYLSFDKIGFNDSDEIFILTIYDYEFNVVIQQQLQKAEEQLNYFLSSKDVIEQLRRGVYYIGISRIMGEDISTVLSPEDYKLVIL